MRHSLGPGHLSGIQDDVHEFPDTKAVKAATAGISGLGPEQRRPKVWVASCQGGPNAGKGANPSVCQVEAGRPGPKRAVLEPSWHLATCFNDDY